LDKVQILKEKLALIQNSPEEINKARSLPEVYELIDRLNDSVKTVYSHIHCKNRCFLCCQHSNIPTATSLEWELAYRFILDSTPEYQLELIDVTQKIFASHGPELKKVHFALNSNDDQFKLDELYAALPAFKGTSCVFLREGSCSIYEARPGKCRTQGFSLMKFGASTQFQTCLPEIVKLNQLLEKQGSRKVLMPIWNDYERKIQELDPAEEVIFSILPVWVYTHIKDNRFIPAVNLKPDFVEILSEL
jgi:Fe-S-cluster containining protein